MGSSFIPHRLCKSIFIFSNDGSLVVDFGINEISNGRWLVEIDDKFDVYDIAFLAGKKLL
ncbi:hypothetical protein [Erwinia mallotivora]